MKNKTLSIIPTVFLAIICATSCNKSTVNRNVVVRGLDFSTSQGSSDVVDLCTVPIAYIGGDLNIPYISMFNLPKLMRIYLGETINGDVYSFVSNNHTYTITNLFNNATLSINFLAGNFTYSDRLQFYNLYEPVDDPLLMVSEDRNVGTIYCNQGDYTHTDGNSFTNSFKDYGINPVTVDTIDYIPFKIAIDILKQSYETNYIYNGDKIYQISSVLSSTQQSNIINEFKQGWCIDQNNPNFLTFAYNELCFYLSQHHGLRKNTRSGRKHDISDYRYFCDHFIYPGDSEPIAKQFTKSARDFNIACCKLFGSGIADAGHTAIIDMYIDSDNIKRSDYYADCNKKDYSKCYQARFDAGLVDNNYELKKEAKFQYYKADGTLIAGTNLSEADTLFYTFDSFDHEQLTDCLEILETISLHSNISNIVVDLINNGGGYVYTLTYLISMLNGNCTMAIKDPLTNEKSKIKCHVDFANRSVDNLSSKNRYILTSPISFSCGNALPCLAKEGGTKIIGQTSGGGCCTVAYGLNCLGVTYAHSSNMMICYGGNNNTWDSVEPGAALDEIITDQDSSGQRGYGSYYDELCDRSAIVTDIIHKT